MEDPILAYSILSSLLLLVFILKPEMHNNKRKHIVIVKMFGWSKTNQLMWNP